MVWIVTSGPPSALNTSECVLHFLGFSMIASGSACMSVDMPSGPLELVRLSGTGGLRDLLIGDGKSWSLRGVVSP